MLCLTPVDGTVQRTRTAAVGSGKLESASAVEEPWNQAQVCAHTTNAHRQRTAHPHTGCCFAAAPLTTVHDGLDGPATHARTGEAGDAPYFPYGGTGEGVEYGCSAPAEGATLGRVL